MPSNLGWVPDLAIEVLLSSTTQNDRGRKMRMFHHYGVLEYWIADPVGETIEICSRAVGEYALARRVSGGAMARSAVVPDLRFPAAAVFPTEPT